MDLWWFEPDIWLGIGRFDELGVDWCGFGGGLDGFVEPGTGFEDDDDDVKLGVGFVLL